MNKKISIYAFMLVALLITLAVPSYNYYSKIILSKKFEKALSPLPQWWDEVEASNVRISNYDELLSYWQSEKRCCSREEIEYTNRQFFKTTYLAILDNISNPDIVMNGVNLMSLSYLDYDNLYDLQILALNTYPEYNKPLNKCANCKTGDVIASMLEDLYSSMAKRKLNNEYIEIANKFLKSRGKEMSDYYEAIVYMKIAFAQEKSGNTSAAIDTLTYIIDHYKNARKSGSLTNTLNSANGYLKRIKQGR